MQYNNTITVALSTFNAFGEETPSTTYAVKCKVLSHGKARKKDKGGTYTQTALKVIIPHKNYAPYNTLYNTENLYFTYNGERFKIADINLVNGFSGKPKFYEIDLTEAANEIPA